LYSPPSCPAPLSLSLVLFILHSCPYDIVDTQIRPLAGGNLLLYLKQVLCCPLDDVLWDLNMKGPEGEEERETEAMLELVKCMFYFFA
jgi:hypothetical protein